MRLLLDTHFLVWMVILPTQLTRIERATLTAPEHELVVSPVSIWELRVKWNQRDRDGNRKGALDPDRALAYIAGNSIELAMLTGADTATSLAVPLAHRDPFDEMLLIHADRLGAKLFTRDRLLAGHPLAYR